MFRFLTDRGTSMLDLSDLHPTTLEALLELGWNSRVKDPTKVLGHPERRSDVDGRPNAVSAPLLAVSPARTLPRIGTINVPAIALDISTFTPPSDPIGDIVPLPGMRKQHMIYAYMIENTRIIDVFRRVLSNYLHGERLSVLSAASQRWAWTTEELFFRDTPSFSTITQTSHLRQNIASTRANLNQRLFGMTLNVSSEQEKVPFQIAEHANVDFVATFDELLHEIWQGRQNFANAVGARPTDDAKIAQLCTRIADMMLSRRAQGTGSREESWAVDALSWFHATVREPNHPVLADLRVSGSSPEERLFNVAQRVNFPAHGLAKSYFELAEPMSRLLIAIESGVYNDAAAAPALYTPPVDPPIPGSFSPVEDTDLIKTHWSIIRGRDIKATRVVTK